MVVFLVVLGTRYRLSSFPLGTSVLSIARSVIPALVLLHLSMLCLDDLVYRRLESVGLASLYGFFMFAAIGWIVFVIIRAKMTRASGRLKPPFLA
jgi:hypothetical protein